MRWQDIPGWFTEADAEVCREIVGRVPDDGRIAEIGVWKGRSIGALATFATETDKLFEIHAIDTFKGTRGDEIQAADMEANGIDLRESFSQNMEALGVSGLWTHQGESAQTTQLFNEGSLDAVFIDGDHSKEAVSADIKAWFPKVKVGGIIAGHDYDYPSVSGAVHAQIPRSKIKTFGRCWLYEKEEVMSAHEATLSVYVPVLDNGMGLVTANYHLSMFSALNEWTKLEEQNGRLIQLRMERSSASHPNRGMNSITTDLLQCGMDEMLVIDTDTIITGKDLFNLFSHDVELVYGGYPKKQMELVLCMSPLGGQEMAVGPTDPPPYLKEIRRSGRGFMRVRRTLFEKLMASDPEKIKFPEFDTFGRLERDFWQSGVVTGSMSYNGNPEWITEDWMLDEFARSIGVPVYWDTRILGRHEGPIVFPPQISEEALYKMMIQFTPEQVEAAAEEAKNWRPKT